MTRRKNLHLLASERKKTEEVLSPPRINYRVLDDAGIKEQNDDPQKMHRSRTSSQAGGSDGVSDDISEDEGSGGPLSQGQRSVHSGPSFRTISSGYRTLEDNGPLFDTEDKEQVEEPEERAY